MARPGRKNENTLDSIQDPWAEIPAPLRIALGSEIESRVILELQDSDLKNENNKSYLRMLKRENEMMHIIHPAQCLAHNKCSINAISLISSCPSVLFHQAFI